jgi:NTE family protein
MPIDDLQARLASATSAATIGPIVRGEDGLGLGPRLQGELVEPDLIKVGEESTGAGRELTFQQFGVGFDAAGAVEELLGAQPALSDVAINLFPREVQPVLEELQGAFLETTLLATVLLSTARRELDGTVDDLVRIAASATPAGRLLRELFADPWRQPPPIDFPPGGPTIPGIPDKLLTTAEALAKKGCVGAVKEAMAKLGRAVQSATAHYLQGAIDGLDPPDNCPGEEMVIRGHGLGTGAGSAVAFTGADGKIVLTPRSAIREWADDHVRLVIPSGAIRGPVGILVFPAAGGTSIGSATSTAIGEVSQCFGAAVGARVEETLNKVQGPPIFPPSQQPTGANLYTGGPPVIDYFEASPSGPLWPNRKVTLSWNVIGATRVEIAVASVAGSAPNELPPISGPQPYPHGSASVTIPGTHAWRGRYVLRAANRCTGAGAVEKPLELEMVIRRGLALGGGGTRGDFQVGALRYLYDEKGYRPDAIAGTSVGSINAIELVMGDTAGGQNAAARLASTWLSLVDETSMWGEEAWLTNAKAQVRGLLRSLSIEGLLALPYTVVAGWIAKSDLQDVFDHPRQHGVVALFNLGPIESRARIQYDQKKTNASGIKLRLVAVSVETGELVMVDETGAVLERGQAPTPAFNAGPAPSTDVVDGAIASATMPGIFPARRLKNNMCVDGGVKEVVPVLAAVRDLGCNDVIAIRVSSRPIAQETDPTRPVGEVMSRSVLDLTFDELADNDVGPFAGWGDGVTVTVLRPNLDLHDPMVVEPGLIRIAIDYGWMRAADVVDVPATDRRYAIELSDKIINLRARNWELAQRANGIPFQDPHRGFSYFLFAGVGSGPSQLQPAPDPNALTSLRANCRQIRDALEQRLLIGAPTPPSATRTAWFTQWETFSGTTLSTDPWSSSAYWQAETAPASI